MIIKELTLYSDDLKGQKTFFEEVLGYETEFVEGVSLSFQVGLTMFRFVYNPEKYRYHYCFLVPSNKLQASMDWLSGKWPLIPNEKNEYINHFEDWNAHAAYFYDGNGNVAEFIVRYDLNNESDVDGFDKDLILSVNEIGLPTKNIKELNDTFEDKMASPFWKGSIERFGTNGTQEGLFIMVNNELKKEWYPTDLKTQLSPVDAVIQSNGKDYRLSISEGKIKEIMEL